ncbi:MAG: bifunctional hydroxymethylpyrimidine kinase/phosphomethylpyrimidine kinase [Wenzhouxiangella sp.]
MHNTAPLVPPTPAPAQALSIAGSDSCGGAGIQADIKTMTLLGVEASTVLTAITAQNTRGVDAVLTLPASLVDQQLNAVLDDLDIRAIKTGMLSSEALVHAIAKRLAQHPAIPLVLDPVMIATSGARLLEPAAEQAILEHLVPRAQLITPNLPEAAVLTGLDEDSPAESLAAALLDKGCQAVLIKGGHRRSGLVLDQLFFGDEQIAYTSARVDGELHGTGCTLAAGICAGLALGHDLPTATERAIEFLQQRIRQRWQTSPDGIAMLGFAAGRRDS